mgnify:CR=1 FL=1|tara:strand:+ start:332 stop:1267 length:936 start_codon:yes stop_codon:yes gene_type:complete
MDNFELEYHSKDDIFNDFMGNPYNPSFTGKLFLPIKPNDITTQLKPSNILFHSISNIDYRQKFFNFFTHLRDLNGNDNSCWGIKNIDGKLEWEMYMYKTYNSNCYNYARIASDKSNFLNLSKFKNHKQNYLMFSFEMKDGVDELEDINFYFNGMPLHNTMMGRHWGNTYSYDGNNYIKQNDYHFFIYDIMTHKRGKLNTLLEMSPMFNSKYINELIPNKIFDYYQNVYKGGNNDFTLCISNKTNSDAVYFVHVNIDILLYFIKKYNYPQELISFIEINKLKFNHLFFDLMIDYKVIDNKLKVFKTAFYNTL